MGLIGGGGGGGTVRILVPPTHFIFISSTLPAGNGIWQQSSHWIKFQCAPTLAIFHTVHIKKINLCLFVGHTVRILGQKKENGKKIGGAKLDLPKIRKNPLVEIIAISTG